MIDSILLGFVRRRKENALGQLIDKYAAYVCTVIRNSASNNLTHEDVEETASDVFLALWENADKVEKLKAWLGATARNKAKNKLRKIRDDLPLDDEITIDEQNEIENTILLSDRQKEVKAAVLAMGDPDSKIFICHYYESQTVAVIASEMGLTEAAVKHRLVRGRKKLETIFKEEVI